MTTTVSIDSLRELASFRAQNGCAISLYLDLDPSSTPTAREAATRVRSLLDAGAKSHGATRGDLAHEVRQGLKADFERLERYFDDGFDRDGAHGLAVFAAGLDNVWSTLALPVPVPDTIRVADDFLLAPLVPLLGRGDGALVVVVNREAGRLLALQGGRLEEVADRSEDAPSRHDQGGWSQSRFQRHIDNVAHEHYKTVAEELERRFRRLQRPRIVVVASEDVRPEFAEVLSNELTDAIIGWASAEQHAGPAELQEVVVPLLESWRAEREAGLVERWREEAGRNGRAVSGWADTLEAASDARVDTLLYQEGIQQDAFRCPACGRAAVEALTCPLDGTKMEPRDDGLDLAVRLTLANGGDVLAVEHRQDLEPVGGVGALLRF
jgi:peptide subunit release factor 1 (eRF1)